MKISELPRLTKVRRDVEIPLAIMGENRNVTLGQILDAVSRDIVPFGMVQGNVNNVQYIANTPGPSDGTILFDTMTDRFYCATSSTSDVLGQQETTWSYYQLWDNLDDYYNESSVRTDCLFRASDGRLYFFDGTTLKSAGLTDEQAKAIAHATPIEVESEEVMEQIIAAGEYDDGQLYFVAEEE